MKGGMSMNMPYLCTADIEEAYFKVVGSSQGMSAFIQAAKHVGTKTAGGAYIYKDEPALWEVFLRFIPVELARKDIISFGHLMQYVC